jgi:hypothetical protein
VGAVVAVGRGVAAEPPHAAPAKIAITMIEAIITFSMKRIMGTPQD